MANLVKITLDDLIKEQAINAIAIQYDYKDFLDNEQTIPNPMSKEEFCYFKIESFIKDNIKAVAIKASVESARIQADTAISETLASAETTIIAQKASQALEQSQEI